MSKKNVGNKIPIYKLKTTKQVMNFYDEWGDKDKYNKDMVDWDYSGPKEMVNTFKKYAKNKGLIFFTINEGIYEEYGFDKKIKELEDKNKWKEIVFFKSDYIASKDINAWLGLYEVIK
ncbi:hypothetical protein N9K40_00770 [Candidatus Pelagibacter sp.]|nr:hypothetical protein [Candidatus Pelagibacter sp.]